MAVSGDFIFFMAAAICQIVVGLIFMIRPSDKKWRYLAGALFIINGSISVTSAISAISQDSYDESARHIAALLDPVTSYIILFMALVFPNPPKFLQGKVWIAGIVVAGAAVAQFSSLLFNPELYDSLYQFTHRDGGGWQGTLYVSFVQEIGWSVLLIRWSRAIVRGVDWQFGLLAAALGVRASHMAIVAVGTRLNKFSPVAVIESGSPYVAWYLFISFIPLLALMYAIFTLLAPREYNNRPAQIFTTFLFVGMVEAVFSMASLAGIEWTEAPFLYLDVLVLRPLLFWGAMYGLPATRPWQALGAVLFYSLCAAAFVPSGLTALKEMQLVGPPAWFFSILFALAMMGMATRFTFPLLTENAWQNPVNHPSNLKPL